MRRSAAIVEPRILGQFALPNESPQEISCQDESDRNSVSRDSAGSDSDLAQDAERGNGFRNGLRDRNEAPNRGGQSVAGRNQTIE